ncbi:hypothetical protein FCIRC_9575 [Fusarium circinatum]|uniref:Uncharacterized protein n=1 Tax=Fusarium circinatum TaxID=48490 RepID=A0A8H5TCG4_FUSCI|nr:hypothetical protein FCIRC_9575 [Fusarium circinatum]
MSDYNPVKDLGLTCPYGGIFYICADDPDRFIGCCTINPCGARKGLCPDKNLRPASFNATLPYEFLPQACINDNVDVSWYTCVGETLPFLGCCAVDPCLRGICSQRDLRAAKLSDKAKNAQDFLDGDPEYMPWPTSSTLEGSSISSSSLCASSTAAMTTMISSFITSFATETTIATITSTVTTTTSAMTILPTEAPDAPPAGSKGHGSNQKLAWLAVIPIFLFLWYCVWKYRCIPRCRARLSKGRPEQRDEQEHQHEQQQQQEHERHPNMLPYPENDQMPTEENHRYIGRHPRRKSPRTTHEHPQNIQGERYENGSAIKEKRHSCDNKEIRSLDMQSGSSQQDRDASVQRTVSNEPEL